jgi:hypothetical protein
MNEVLWEKHREGLYTLSIVIDGHPVTVGEFRKKLDLREGFMWRFTPCFDLDTEIVLDVMQNLREHQPFPEWQECHDLLLRKI